MLLGMGTEQGMIFETLRRYIIDRRHALGISQAEAARRGGFKAGTLANLEAGNRPSIPRQETLQGIAKGLGVPYENIDRIVRGLSPEPDAVDVMIANHIKDLSPDGQRLVLEWLTMPDEQRRTVEAGLTALLAALRQQSQGP